MCGWCVLTDLSSSLLQADISRCGHAMHRHCQTEFISHGNFNCPICAVRACCSVLHLQHPFVILLVWNHTWKDLADWKIELSVCRYDGLKLGVCMDLSRVHVGTDGGLSASLPIAA